MMTDPLHWLSLGDLARENRRRYTGRVAAVCGSTRYTYDDLDERSTRMADALTRAGVGAGDRVLWLGQNCHRVVELLLASAKIGAIFCPANWRSSTNELRYILHDWQPTVVFWQEQEVGPRVEPLRDDGVGALWVRHDGELSQYEAMVATGSPVDTEQHVDASGPVLAIYTAAFSGRPRAALLSHTGLLLQGAMLSMVMNIDATAVSLIVNPMFHIGVWNWVLPTLLQGGRNVFVRRVDAEELCRVIDAERCTRANLVPATQAQMADCNADGHYDLSSLSCAGPDPRWTAMVADDPIPWSTRPGTYGQTELTGLAAFGCFGPPGTGSAGRTSPFVQLRIVDEDGREAPVGAVGEIAARGPIVMVGYHGEERSPSSPSGWRRTNDLGRREDDGSITFVGPKSAMLKCGVENVYPAEVESVLRQHPHVADCGVIGVPDDRFVQAVRAIVVLREGATATEDDIVEHCRPLLAGFKRPKSVVFADALPRVGPAIDYGALDRQYEGGGYPGAGTRSAWDVAPLNPRSSST